MPESAKSAGLDRRAILDAALELTDEFGLEGLTMRRLGERLGTSQMAPYRHFSGRGEIIRVLADDLLSRVRLPETAADEMDPDERIIDFSLRARRVLLAHPALVPVIAERPLAESTSPEDLAALATAYEEAGFAPENIQAALRATVSVSLGLILLETTRDASNHRGEGGRTTSPAIPASLRGGDGDPPDGDLLAEAAGENWAEAVYEMAVLDCFEGLKRRN